MEWGPRALGNRSILASPLAPFVLENLNAFLKHREPHRSYSVSVCAEDLSRYFRGPATSQFMEYEYDVIDPQILRALLPAEFDQAARADRSGLGGRVSHAHQGVRRLDGRANPGQHVVQRVQRADRLHPTGMPSACSTGPGSTWL